MADRGKAQDNIAVGFQAFWDKAGDEIVISAVQRIAKEIDKILSESVNFAKSFDALGKIADSFEKVAKANGAITDAAKKSKKATQEQVESLEDLIQKYRELDASIKKDRPSTPYHVAQEIATRSEALKTLQKALKGDTGDQKNWLEEQYKKQFQALQVTRGEYKRLTTESEALRASVNATVANTTKYRDEIKRVNAEAKRWTGNRFGEEGLDRQISQYKKLAEIRKRQADEGLILDEKAAQIINRLNAQIRELTRIKQAEAKVDRETKEARESNRKAELAELQRLTQAQTRLQQQIAKRASGSDNAELALRSKLERELGQIILRRIQLGDDDVVNLRKQYDALQKQRITVEEVAASYSKLMAAFKEPMAMKSLADVRQQLLQIKEALALLDQMRRMPGSQSAGISYDAETQRLATEKQRLLYLQRDLGKAAVADLDAEKAKTAEQQKQITLVERQTAEMRRLAAIIGEARRMGGITGAEIEIDGIKALKANMAEMQKSGTISVGSYVQQYNKLSSALTDATNRLRAFKKAQQDASRETVTEVQKAQAAVKKLEAEYEALGQRVAKVGNSIGGMIIKHDLLGKQMGIAKKLISEYGYNISENERRLSSLGASHAKLGAKIETENHRMGRSFMDLIKWQAEWYSGTMLILGTTFALGNAIKSAFDFTQEIRDAGAVVGATKSELEALRNAALTVGITTTMSAKEAAEALKILGQAGLDAKESIYALDVVAKMMLATGADVNEVVGALTTAMNVWEIKGEKITDLGNMMAAAMNYSKLEMKDLGVIFNYLASTAEQVGWSFQQVAGAAAVLANHGIRTSTIGTGLSQAIAALIAPTDRTIQVFKRFGITMDDINPRAKSFSEILAKMAEKGMQAEDLYKAFNVRTARIMAAALTAGADAFKDMTTSITDTNAMLKMVDESLQGARNQFKLLANEIQNAFNQAVSDGESTLAVMAKGLRWLTHGAIEAIVPIAGLNVALMVLNANSTKAAGGITLLRKAIGFFGGYWALAAVAISAGIAALASWHKTADEQIVQLKEEANQHLVTIETIRQRNIALDEAQKKLEKNSGSQEELRRIRGDIIAQYPGLIGYILAEGEAINGNVKNYQSLIDAMEKYKLAGIRDTKTATSGYFATISKELETLGLKEGDIRAKYESLRKLAHDALNAMPYSSSAKESYTAKIKTYARDEQVELNKIQLVREAFIRDSAKEFSKLLKAGWEPEEMKALLETMFSGPDLDIMKKNFTAVADAHEAAQRKISDGGKLTEKEAKHRLEIIDKTYQGFIANLTDNFEALKERIENSSAPEEKRRMKLVDVERERVTQTMKLLQQEANEKIAIIFKTEDTVSDKLAKTGKVEADLSKQRRKLNKEMYAFAKEQAQQVQADIDKSYSWKEKGLQDEIKWREQLFKLEESETALSIRKVLSFYQDRTEKIIELDEEATKLRIKNLKEAHLSEKDYAEMAEKVFRDSAQNQIAAHEEFRDTMLNTYKELKGKAKELRKEAADILKDSKKDSQGWAELSQKIFGKGKGQSYDATMSQVKDLERAMRDAMMGGTTQGYEQARDIAKKAQELMGGIDFEAAVKQKGFPSLITSEIEGSIKYFEKHTQEAAKALAALKQAEASADEGGASAAKKKALAENEEIKQLREELSSSEGVAIKLRIDKEDLKRQVGEADVLLMPKFEPQALVEFKQQIQESKGDTAIPVIPKLDEAGFLQMKTELQQPTENPHTVQPNTNEAQAAIAALAVDTHSTHYVHVVTVNEGGGSSTGSTSTTGYPEGFADGGYLGGGWGGGDRLHILAEMGEYIANKFAVRYYGRDFFELLNAQAVPREIVHHLARNEPPKFKDGGMIEVPSGTPNSTSEFFVVRLQMGDEEFPLEVRKGSKSTFDQFVDRYGKEKLMRRKR